jgi:phosphatidylglycerophosphatase A
MHEIDERPPKSSLAFAYDLIASGLYSGHSPLASGTCGTIAAAILFYLATLLCPSASNLTTLLSFTIALFFIGVWVSYKALELGIYEDKKDPGEIVIDEFVGYYVSILTIAPSPIALALAFFWFRVFDIIKPPPVRQLERLPNGWGIMADDVAAGIMALLTTKACLYYIGTPLVFN